MLKLPKTISNGCLRSTFTPLHAHTPHVDRQPQHVSIHTSAHSRHKNMIANYRMKAKTKLVQNDTSLLYVLYPLYILDTSALSLKIHSHTVHWQIPFPDYYEIRAGTRDDTNINYITAIINYFKHPSRNFDSAMLLSHPCHNFSVINKTITNCSTL